MLPTKKLPVLGSKAMLSGRRSRSESTKARALAWLAAAGARRGRSGDLQATAAATTTIR
jgi:hypothetical protein